MSQKAENAKVERRLNIPRRCRIVYYSLAIDAGPLMCYYNNTLDTRFHQPRYHRIPRTDNTTIATVTESPSGARFRLSNRPFARYIYSLRALIYHSEAGIISGHSTEGTTCEQGTIGTAGTLLLADVSVCQNTSGHLVPPDTLRYRF